MDINRALNVILSDEYKLLVKTRNFHWNVTGPFFGPLHALFGDQYNQLNELTDVIAERIRQLKGTPFGSMQQFTSVGKLSECPSNADNPASPGYTEMISLLNQDHEKMVADLRAAATKIDPEDCVTANIILDWAAKHEKMAWFLRAHLGSDDQKK